MSVFGRMNTVFQAKMSKVLDNAEDPNETLDYSYEKQLQLLQNVRRGLADLVTSKRRLQMQHDKLQQDMSHLDEQAQTALQQNREDLARMALTRKSGLQQQIGSLDAQIQGLEAQQQKLTDAQQRLQTKIETFRTTKETIKAQYTASQAQVKISEAATGISEEMADVGLAVQRAQDKTEQMQARASALDDLVATGALSDFSSGENDIDRQLSDMSAQSDVDHQLAAMKAQLQLPGGGSQAALPSQSSEAEAQR
jgi:phage shock protein A